MFIISIRQKQVCHNQQNETSATVYHIMITIKYICIANVTEYTCTGVGPILTA